MYIKKEENINARTGSTGGSGAKLLGASATHVLKTRIIFTDLNLHCDYLAEMSTDTFIYKIPFEGTAELRIKKKIIVNAVSNRVGRPLTDTEADKVWKEIKHRDDWYSMFPSWAAQNGVHMYGSDDSINYAEMFKEDIETAANKTVNDVWENVFENVLDSDLDKAVADLHVDESEEEITLANVDKQTQKCIQEDNVRNGLARCANETKKKSIEKWKRNYFLMEHNLDIQNIALPDGKTEEDFIKHLEEFVREKKTT